MERNVPKLRFKEFNDEWIEYKLGEKTCIYDGTHQTPKYTDHGVKFVSVENIEDIYGTDKFISEEDYENGFKIKPQLGDIFMTRITAGVIGATAIVDKEEELAFYVSLALIRVIDKNLNSLFLKKYIESIYFKKELNKRIIHVAFPKKINLGDIGECSVNLPSLQEQERIANFLTKVDKIIEKQEEKVKNLENYKKGMMQKIFSQEIRFKDENGEEYPEWEEKKLSEILIERKEKNYGELRVCSVAVKKGIVDQIQHLGRSFAAKDTSNYKVVKLGDVVYTKSPTGEFPFGIIKQSFLDEDVVVSPLYGVFEPINISVGYILHNYFNYKENTNNYLYSIIQKGAKNTINISNETFLSKTLKIPVARNEQIKISNLLHNINSIIDKENNKLEKLKQWKKGLLQQMFV